MQMKWIVAAAAAGMLSGPARADTITVVTSFPSELTNAYKAAYEKKFPNDKVEILNKGTSSGIAFVREQSAGSRAEIFWASAPDAFEVLASAKLLEKVDVPTKGIPDKIGSYPINDPEGFYRGQALAGYADKVTVTLNADGSYSYARNAGSAGWMTWTAPCCCSPPMPADT